MDKKTAINELLWQAVYDRLSFTSYKRALTAVKVLDLGGDAGNYALARLGYLHRDTYEPFDWLAKKISKAGKRSPSIEAK